MSTVFPNQDNLLPTAMCRCEDCGVETPAAELDPISDIEQRVSVGEPMPAGQCPDCGAVAHPIPYEQRLMQGMRAILLAKGAERKRLCVQWGAELFPDLGVSA
jgi:hypothetical protein